ncbi:hypothetical protein E7747_06400 [Duncaniella dubosii]|uniref:Uncharacterized protein n=1 Tax=Duncaniella dubosii TaxID=2518971 RepID=A0A4P7W3H4_9BACT|nr:hypothetical protein [Duncaniella dubosii]QCD41945.1 hypothetical protein E7747_06400 [Duncaniella dubosii]
MSVTLLHNAEIVNEGRRYRGYVLTDGQLIVRTGEESTLPATALTRSTRSDRKQTQSSTAGVACSCPESSTPTSTSATRD